MPKTLSVYAKEVHVIAELSAAEIQKLDMAFNMCVGGPGRTPEEKEAWAYFTEVFYPYIHQHHEDLSKKAE